MAYVANFYISVFLFCLFFVCVAENGIKANFGQNDDGKVCTGGCGAIPTQNSNRAADAVTKSKSG